MNPKPDDRRDNVEKIQRNINNTIKNIDDANEMSQRIDNPKTKQELQAKNARREEALDGMRKEIADEAKDREQGYK